MLANNPYTNGAATLMGVVSRFSNLKCGIFAVPRIPAVFARTNVGCLAGGRGFFFRKRGTAFLARVKLRSDFAGVTRAVSGPIVVIYSHNAVSVSACLARSF